MRRIWTALSLSLLCGLTGTTALAQTSPVAQSTAAPAQSSAPARPDAGARPPHQDSAPDGNTPGRNQEFLVRYTGELIDQAASPISGVFGIHFRLFENQGDTAPVWTERSFVAVANGAYTIDLGALTPIPRTLQGKRLWLAVDVDTLGELVRDPLVLRAYQPPPPAVGRRLADLSFAALADRALLADRAFDAENSQRLGGKTLAEIDRYPELYRQFMELRQQVTAIRHSGGTRVARRTTTMDAIGGPGGAGYRVACPDGQVMVGITGRAGNVVDAISIICAPLENVR